MTDENNDRPWHKETAKILEEIGCLKRAEAKHYSALDKRITGLQHDLKLHKVKTGFVASISAAFTFLAAWALASLRGGG